MAWNHEWRGQGRRVPGLLVGRANICIVHDRVCRAVNRFSQRIKFGILNESIEFLSSYVNPLSSLSASALLPSFLSFCKSAITCHPYISRLAPAAAPNPPHTFRSISSPVLGFSKSI